MASLLPRTKSENYSHEKHRFSFFFSISVERIIFMLPLRVYSKNIKLGQLRWMIKWQLQEIIEFQVKVSISGTWNFAVPIKPFISRYSTRTSSTLNRICPGTCTTGTICSFITSLVLDDFSKRVQCEMAISFGPKLELPRRLTIHVFVYIFTHGCMCLAHNRPLSRNLRMHNAFRGCTGPGGGIRDEGEKKEKNRE